MSKRHEVSVLFGCDAASVGIWFPILPDSVVVTSWFEIYLYNSTDTFTLTFWKTSRRNDVTIWQQTRRHTHHHGEVTTSKWRHPKTYRNTKQIRPYDVLRGCSRTDSETKNTHLNVYTDRQLRVPFAHPHSQQPRNGTTAWKLQKFRKIRLAFLSTNVRWTTFPCDTRARSLVTEKWKLRTRFRHSAFKEKWTLRKR